MNSSALEFRGHGLEITTLPITDFQYGVRLPALVQNFDYSSIDHSRNGNSHLRTKFDRNRMIGV